MLIVPIAISTFNLPLHLLLSKVKGDGAGITVDPTIAIVLRLSLLFCPLWQCSCQDALLPAGMSFENWFSIGAPYLSK
jgi:hypothetical protein